MHKDLPIIKSQYWLLKIKKMSICIIFLKIYFLKNDLRGNVILFWKISFWEMSIRLNVHSG